jgi:hypothetical protein
MKHEHVKANEQFWHALFPTHGRSSLLVDPTAVAWLSPPDFDRASGYLGPCFEVIEPLARAVVTDYGAGAGRLGVEKSVRRKRDVRASGNVKTGEIQMLPPTHTPSLTPPLSCVIQIGRQYGDVMMAVTGAVVQAEQALSDAITYYEELVAAEQAIVDHPHTSADDKKVASQGVKIASEILQGLKTLRPD